MNALVLSILLIVSVVSGAKVSSKIDFDDDEPTPPSTLSSAVLKAFVDLNQGAGLGPKSPGIIPKQPPHGFRPPAPRPSDDNDYINIEELFKPNRRQDEGSRFGSGQDVHSSVTTTSPTIINNIHVTINTNDSGPGVNGCKNGECDVKVTSTPDANGNVVTNVHFSVVTKLKKVPDVEDIPVIDGTRGTGHGRRPNYDTLPPFHFSDQQHFPNVESYFDNNIPQVPIHRRDPELRTWFQTPKVFLRPAAPWPYARSLDHGHRGLHGHMPWSPSTAIVDDKIEPPLSRTKPNNQH